MYSVSRRMTSIILLNKNDIGVFKEKTNRSNNDIFNKKRENIICSIIEKKIPNNYYEDKEWLNIKNNLLKCINSYFNNIDIDTNNGDTNNGDINVNTLKCKQKGGRNFHYDFDLNINNSLYKIEFKFNTDSIDNTPQFLSLSKPSQYFNKCFESYFYDNQFNEITNFGKLKKPDKDIYLKTNCNNKVACLEKYKEKYNSNTEFKNFCKKKDKEGIKNFLNEAKLDLDKISKKLKESQEGKKYLCFKDGDFCIKEINTEHYKLKKVVKVNPTNIVCETDSGMFLEFRLRFKNGCGLQFPALQIKRKLPTVAKLKQICTEHKIKLKNKMKKQDILDILDEKNIIY